MPVIAFALGGMVASYALVTYVTFVLVKRNAIPGWYVLVLLGLLVVILILAVLGAWAAWTRNSPFARQDVERPDVPNTSRWSFAFALLSLLCPVLVVILIAMEHWIGSPSGNAPRHAPRYGAIIDAGSSGSRLAIFGWQAAANGRPHVWQIASVEDEDAAGFKCPLTGLLKSATDTCACLVKLGERAREAAVRSLGKPDLSPIPLWVKATAGVRRESEPGQARILGATDRCLARAPGYAWRGAEVISGAREGVYAWLAVNHLAQTLDAERAQDTHGIVEIGGQSAQIAYRVSGPISPPPLLGEIVTVPLGSREIHVYAVSDYLGKEAAVEAMGKEFPEECKQDRDPGKCIQQRINPFLCSKTPKGRSCPGHGQNVFPPAEMRFAGLSNFAYAARNLQVKSDSSLEEVRTRADAVCGSGQKKKDERDELLKLVRPKHKDYVCFDAFYATQLARYGWDLPLDRVSPPDSRWASEPSWPLGAMILEAAKGVRVDYHSPSMLY